MTLVFGCLVSCWDHGVNSFMAAALPQFSAVCLGLLLSWYLIVAAPHDDDLAGSPGAGTPTVSLDTTARPDLSTNRPNDADKDNQIAALQRENQELRSNLEQKVEQLEETKETIEYLKSTAATTRPDLAGSTDAGTPPASDTVPSNADDIPTASSDATESPDEALDGSEIQRDEEAGGINAPQADDEVHAEDGADPAAVEGNDDE
ncbi:MAG: hypothetical protein SGILL_006876, partial [Bacillariaceae sp.]